MSDGIRAMMRAAERAPLDFPVSLYVGQVVVSGRVAPPAMWHHRSADGAKQAMERRVRELVFAKKTKAALADALKALDSDIARVHEVPEDRPDEVTLIDVTVYPAIGNSGGKSGGFTLPVARIPLQSIAMWWLAEGDELKGSSGVGGFVGMSFPLG